MKAEEARTIADDALQQLTEALAAGKSEALTNYLAMLARFHRYSFGNVLMILSQKPEATHVAGFHTWRQMNRFVKKGEKGIVIIAPMSIRPKDAKSADVASTAEPHATEVPSSTVPNAPAGEPSGKRSKPILRFRGVYVFDVSQTEGEPLPEPAKVSGDPAEHLARLKSVIVQHGITLDYDDVPHDALGVSRGGRISIRPGLSPAEEFSVTVHELAHERLHHRGERPSSKTVRETEAEAVAFVVCRAIGLDTNSAASDYIQMYDGSGEKAAETLAASLDRVQHVAAEIIAAVQAADEPPVVD